MALENGGQIDKILAMKALPVVQKRIDDFIMSFEMNPFSSSNPQREKNYQQLLRQRDRLQQILGFTKN